MLALGTTSCSSSSRFDATSVFKDVVPVTLPPGRFKLATRPTVTGSALVLKTIGMVVVAALAASAEAVVGGSDYGDLALNQVCNQHRKPVRMVFCPPAFNRYILAFDKRGLVQAPMKRGQGLPGITGRFPFEEANDRHLCLLRARRERPRDSSAA